MIDTRLITIGETIDEEELFQVAAALVKGALVGMPTETVYGLAGNAFLPEVVARIFAVKGRPQDNPLIVHLYDKDQIEQVVSETRDIFPLLYDAFCPGPLTMVMPKNELIPDRVSAGLGTVGVRFPAQRTARALLRLANVPVVAPSGNLSGGPSPTKAEHMADDLQGKIEYILDDGPCDLGVESTVLDLTSIPPRILRPGVITAGHILERTGILVADDKSHLLKASGAVPSSLSGDAEPSHSYSENEGSSTDNEAGLSRIDSESTWTPLSPGQKYRHYSPRAEVLIARGENEEQRADFIIKSLAKMAGRKSGFFGAEATYNLLKIKLAADTESLSVLNNMATYLYPGPGDDKTATRELFSAFRALDKAGAEIIIAEEFPRNNYGAAYMNRLEKAAERE